MRFDLGERAILACGDKGDVVNIAIFPRDEDDWELFKRELTAERIAAQYGSLVTGTVERFEFTASKGLNFVMRGALGGGVSISLRTDPHGKALADLAADIELDGGRGDDDGPGSERSSR
jgi:hypothetical protein